MHLPLREAVVLGAVVRMTNCGPFQQMVSAWADGCSNLDEVNVQVVARACGLTSAEKATIFEPSGILRQLGLIEDRRGGDICASRTILTLLGHAEEKQDAIVSALLGETRPTSLMLADFAHLGSAAQTLPGLVAGALAAGEKGVGILFHGAPGTGKTEYARLLGSLLDAHVVFVGEIGEEGREPSREDRMAHLALLSAMGSRIGRVIAVVDEADDIFTGIDDAEAINREGSKVFMNRIVETCPVPTVWISNHPQFLGASVVRRMVQALEFREPDMKARRRIVARHAEAQDVALDAAEAERLAELPAPPAVIEAGIRAARLGADASTSPSCVVQSLLKAMGRSIRPAAAPSTVPFDPALSSADIDLAKLEERVAVAGPGALSFLFSGLPGTGKSAYARHLAARLGLDVMEKRASDLLDMFVGSTEKRIAEAFEEAADRKMFLILDEVDSLLSERRDAQQSWEVSRVNEMLTWMERHPFPFACTTNFAEHLDQAAARRFLFKVKFGAMRGDQAIVAFRNFFGAEPPASIGRLDPLTPADFAVVARKASILKEYGVDAIAAMLSTEVEAKSGKGQNRIGF